MRTTQFLLPSLGVFFVVLCVAVAAQAESEAEIAYGEARTAFENGQFKKARNLSVTASQTDSKNPDIHLLLGKAEYQLGNIKEAMEAWRQTLRLAPQQAYAKQMLEVLTGQAVDADARLRIAAGLLMDGLLQPAAGELDRVRREKTLSEQQHVELLLLEAEYHVLSGGANESLEKLRQLAVRFPAEVKKLRTRLLSAQAQVRSGGDLVPQGLAELKKLIAEHGDAPQAVAAELELILRELNVDPKALPPLVAWIKAHADHGSAGAARRRLIEAVGKLGSTADPAVKIGPQSPLSEEDKLALSTAAEAYPLLVRVEDALALTGQLLDHVEKRYVADKAYAAAEAAVKQLLAMPLPPAGKEAAEGVLERITEAVDADAYQRIAFELDQGAIDTAALVQWIDAHPQHPSLTSARQRLLAAHLMTAAKQPAPGADAEFAASDVAALEVARQLYQSYGQGEDAVKLTQQLIEHFEGYYAARKAFAAARAGLKELLALPLPPSSIALAQQAIKRVDEQVATTEYNKILLRAPRGEPVAGDLAVWIKAHPKHARVAEARGNLVDAYLNETKQAAAPDADSALSTSDAAALAVAGQMFAEYTTAADSLNLVQKLAGHLETHYAARKAYAAAIDGVKKLLECSLPRSIRSHALHALAGLQTTAALSELKTDAADGRIKPGPLPASLAAVLDSYATLNKESPASPTWQLQGNLANEVFALAASFPWPDRISEPKPPHNWALEIALPVVESGDAAAVKTAVTVVTGVVNDCAAVKQESARGLATRIHARLLVAIEPAQDTWPAEMLRHVDLAAADAKAVFDENLRTGRGGENAKLNSFLIDAVATLRQFVTARPVKGAEALSKLGEFVKPWVEYRHYDAVEQAYVALEAALPHALQRESTLIVAESWVKQVTDRHQRLISAGMQVPRELDPLAQKALLRCYEMQRGLRPDHPLVGRARALRSTVIGHYQALEYFDVAEAAIQVKVEEPVDSAEAHAELELARLKLAMAKRELDRRLEQYKGRESIGLTEGLETAIAALKQFITDHPNSTLVSQAVNELFGIGQTFQSYERYEVAADVYRDVEQFAQGVEALMEAAPGSLNTAERAALAAAETLHTRATKALAKQRGKQPADAKPPTQLSEEFAAAIVAYAAIIQNYADGPVLSTAVEKIKSIALEYARIDAWAVCDRVYADLLAQKLPLRYPEKMEFARAVCLLGRVMPDHARQLLTALTHATRPGSGGGEPMLALAGRGDDGKGLPKPDGKPAGPRTSPSGEGSEGAGTPAEPPADKPAPQPGPSPVALEKARAAEALKTLGADFSELDQDAARREVELLAAVQRQQSSIATRVAQLRDSAIKFNIQQAQGRQAVVQAASAVLSDAEIDRRQKVLDAAYAALQALAKKYPHTPTALQARGEVMVIAGHWREIGQWERAAELAKRFLADNPRDTELPKIRQEIAGDLLAWAGQAVKKQSKEEMLDQVSKRFRKAREELSAIVDDFPDDDALKHQAQWEIANSYLAQARVVAAFSPTLARGQYVRSADELLRVAELYHDHPQIASIPQMLWEISNELSGRGYYDEAITVWNDLTIHCPMHQLSQQAAVQIAQTYQTQLRQPLRAVEAYLELNFGRGGADASLQEIVFQIAVNLKNERRWVEALHVLETFTNAFPEHPQAGQALTLIGQIHQTNEAWEDAIAAYQRVIDEYQNGEWIQQARWAIAECIINLSRWNEAIAAYREFVASYGKDPKVAEANRRIQVLKSLARYQKVVDEEGQRKAFDAQYQIGSIVRSQLSNRVKAIIEFRKMAKKWPDEHLADDALYQVGVLYVELGETEKAREVLLTVADKYPSSPLADDALFMVGKSHEDEAQRLSTVTRTKSVELANTTAQKQAYQLSQTGRRMTRARGQQRLTELKQAGQLEEADNEAANFAARNKAFDQVNAQVIANWSQQQAEVLTAQQLADRQDKINAALRKAVDSYRRAAAMVAGDKADDALLRMADIYDSQLKDDAEAMAAWLEIVEQFGGTSVAENSSWKIAQYYERHGQHEKAIDAYQKFLHSYRNSSKAGDAMIAVAENYELLGKWVDAMDAYTNYLNKFPEGPHVQRAREQITWIKTYRL